MDILNRKTILATICLLSAVALIADEDQSETTPQLAGEAPEAVLEPTSPKTTETTDKEDTDAESVQSATQTSQSIELKPLVLKERIRAHANIDLPQDI